MVIVEVQAETKEEGITTKQRELLKRVVKGFKLREVLAVIFEVYGWEEVHKEYESVKEWYMAG